MLKLLGKYLCVLKCTEEFSLANYAKQVDGSDKKKKGGSGFQVGKRKVKTKLSALAKAKAEQAMEVDK